MLHHMNTYLHHMRIYIHVFDYSYMSSLNIPTESYSVTHFNFKV